MGAALRAGGAFLFDLNMEEQYALRSTGATAIFEDDCVCVVQGSYAPEQKLARFDATIFRRGGAVFAAGADEWQRSDATIWERCYSELEVRTALHGAGFEAIEAFDWRGDLDPAGEAGRTFFHCRKPC